MKAKRAKGKKVDGLLEEGSLDELIRQKLGGLCRLSRINQMQFVLKMVSMNAPARSFEFGLSKFSFISLEEIQYKKVVNSNGVQHWIHFLLFKVLSFDESNTYHVCISLSNTFSFLYLLSWHMQSESPWIESIIQFERLKHKLKF